jgi:hypothetical protein
MPRRISLAIDIGHHLMRAAQVRPGGPGRPARVTATVFERLPEDLDREDAAGVGRRLAAAMDEAGMSRGLAVFALDRSITSFKRLDLPTTNPDELADMVRIAVERDLPIDSDEAVIDFTVIGRSETGTTVESVAVPRREVDRIREIAAAAGLVVGRIAPRCHGSLRLADPNEATLVVDVTGEGLELALAIDGTLPWSRGIEIKGPDGGPPTAEQLVPEARRSWISYRLSNDDVESPRLLVLGGEQAENALDAVAEATGLEASRFVGDRRVKADADMRGVWPLVGLLLSAPASATVDLASPRKAPDIAARWRQRGLAMAGLAIVAAGAGWTIGHRELVGISDLAAELQGKASAANTEHLRFKRDDLRVAHLEAWTGVRPDWLEQLLVVAEPGMRRGGAVLDEFGGVLEGGDVEYDDRKKAFTTASAIRLAIEGEAASFDRAAGVRDDLVRDDRYVLRNTGGESRGGRRLPHPFAFSLRSMTLDPGGDGEGAGAILDFEATAVQAAVEADAAVEMEGEETPAASVSDVTSEQSPNERAEDRPVRERRGPRRAGGAARGGDE